MLRRPTPLCIRIALNSLYEANLQQESTAESVHCVSHDLNLHEGLEGVAREGYSVKIRPRFTGCEVMALSHDYKLSRGDEKMNYSHILNILWVSDS